MLSYRVTLDVPVQLVLFVSRLLADRRREIGTRRGTRALTCFGQAVFVLAWFRDRPDVRRLGQGSGISQATAYRYLDEAVEVRRERRAIRTAPAEGIDWPHAAQVLRIRRDSGPTHGPWTHKEIVYGITSLPADLADPRHLGIYARQHRAIENREHYVPDKTFGEDLQPGLRRVPELPRFV